MAVTARRARMEEGSQCSQPLEHDCPATEGHEVLDLTRHHQRQLQRERALRVFKLLDFNSGSKPNIKTPRPGALLVFLAGMT